MQKGVAWKNSKERRKEGMIADDESRTKKNNNNSNYKTLKKIKNKNLKKWKSYK